MTKSVLLTDLTHKKLQRLAHLLTLEKGVRVTIQDAAKIAIEEGVSQRIKDLLDQEESEEK